MLPLESALNDVDPQARRNALEELAALVEQGALAVEPPRDVANMHCHTFYSFNAYGLSPSALAWLAKKRGYGLIGIVDFDVLDAVDEFLAACDRLGVRGSAGIETRVVIPDFLDREINSPGEPGIAYHMGIGFTTGRTPDSERATLDGLRERAARRNRDVIARVNAHLDPVTLDYGRDVLPLTPGGNPTERHIVLAYVRAAEARGGDVAAFWADKLKMERDEVIRLMADAAKFQNTVRARLMKQGGVGYVPPRPEAFPSVDEFHRLIVACGALPCAAWLDGALPGEQNYEELLGLLIEKGAVALNIVPDRNWNIADPETKQFKLAKLYQVVRLAAELDLPLNIGTEMNAPGNKFIDDFDSPELAPLRNAFMDGAYFIYGHTAMQRRFGMGYQSDWARAYLPTRRERNAFYTRVGRALPPGAAPLRATIDASENTTPADILTGLEGRG